MVPQRIWTLGPTAATCQNRSPCSNLRMTSSIHREGDRDREPDREGDPQRAEALPRTTTAARRDVDGLQRPATRRCPFVECEHELADRIVVALIDVDHDDAHRLV